MTYIQDKLLEARGDGMEEQKEELDVTSPMSAGGFGDNSTAPAGIGVPFEGGGGAVEPSTPEMVGDEHGFRAQLEMFVKSVFGGCGHAIEAASFFVQERTCRWPLQQRPRQYHPAGPPFYHPHMPHPPHNYYHPHHPYPYPVPPPPGLENQPPQNVAPPLSIAEELRHLAAQNPQHMMPPPQYYPHHPRGDIPRFLGEDAIYNFEDDDVSAISQNTLEEMAQKNGQMEEWARRKSDYQQQQHRRPSDGDANVPQPSSVPVLQQIEEAPSSTPSSPTAVQATVTISDNNNHDIPMIPKSVSTSTHSSSGDPKPPEEEDESHPVVVDAAEDPRVV